MKYVCLPFVAVTMLAATAGTANAGLTILAIKSGDDVRVHHDAGCNVQGDYGLAVGTRFNLLDLQSNRVVGGEPLVLVDASAPGLYQVTPAPWVTADPGLTICEGEQVRLSVPSQYDFIHWSPDGQTTPAITVGPRSTTSYQVYVSDTGCGTGTVAFDLNVIPTSSLNITPDDPSICDGFWVILDAGPDFDSYLWSPGGETSRTLLANPSETTEYSVEVTNSCGTYVDSETVSVVLSDPTAPVVTNLTLNDVPFFINGSGPAGGRMSVPALGFKIGTFFLEDLDSGINPAALAVRVSEPIGGGAGSGGYDAFADLGEEFTIDTSTNPFTAEWLVPENLAFPEGEVVHLTASVDDLCGNPSVIAELTFQIDAAGAQRLPFEIPGIFFLDFDRDVWATIATSAGSNVRLLQDPDADGNMTDLDAGNGIPDFREDLWMLGLGVNPSQDPPVPVPNTLDQDSNQVIDAWVREAIVEVVEDFFPGVDNLFLSGEGPDWANLGSPALSRSASTITILCLGGSNNRSGTLPQAHTNGVYYTGMVDYQNQTDEFLCTTPASQPSYLGLVTGIHSTNILYDAVNGQSLRPFRQAVDPLVETRGGVPVGKDPLDPEVLDPDFDRGTGTPEQQLRYDTIRQAVEVVARIVGFAAAHQAGHSFGLSVGREEDPDNRAQPNGLYGNMTEHFGPSSHNTGNHHGFSEHPPYDTTINLMRGSWELDELLENEARACELCLAYLRQRALSLDSLNGFRAPTGVGRVESIESEK